MHDRSRTSSLLYKSTIVNMTDCGHLVIELGSKDFQIRVRLRHVSQIRPILAPARIVSTSSNATASREAIKGEETHHREKRSAEREPQLLAFLSRHLLHRERAQEVLHGFLVRADVETCRRTVNSMRSDRVESSWKTTVKDTHRPRQRCRLRGYRSVGGEGPHGRRRGTPPACCRWTDTTPVCSTKGSPRRRDDVSD